MPVTHSLVWLQPLWVPTTVEAISAPMALAPAPGAAAGAGYRPGVNHVVDLADAFDLPDALLDDLDGGGNG